MVAQPTALFEGSHDRGYGLHWSRPVNRRHGFIGPRQLELGRFGYCGTKMGSPENADGDIVRALSDDHATSWANFRAFASPAVWKASLNAAPRHQQAVALFDWLRDRLHADRLMLPFRLEASGLPVAAFLVREISKSVDYWLVDLFRSGSPDAGEALVRVLLPEIRAWVRSAAKPGRQSDVENTVQDVLVGLLANNGECIKECAGSGKRIKAYAGSRKRIKAYAGSRKFIKEYAGSGKRIKEYAGSRKFIKEYAGSRKFIKEFAGSRKFIKAYAGSRKFIKTYAGGRKRIKKYAGSDQFRRYLQKTVKNLAIDSMRRETGRWRLDAKTGAWTGGRSFVSLTDDEHPIELVDERANPEETVLEANRMAATLELVRALPPDVRRIMEARFLDGDKPLEIAKHTGRDVKAIYRILEHTLFDLKKALK